MTSSGQREPVSKFCSMCAGKKHPSDYYSPAFGTEAAMLVLDVIVGHAGNVGAHDVLQRLVLDLLPVTGGKLLRHLHEKVKDFRDYLFGPFVVRRQDRAAV